MPSIITPEQKKKLDILAVENFREYLQIPSVHPNINYGDCVEFLKKQAKSLELPLKICYCAPGKPIVIISWIGEEPDLPSILLNSHMDVVPVFPDKWDHDPFGAEIVDEKIYARGTQDMKSVGIQYLEAIRRFKLQGIALKRTIHVTFVPDEETGGEDGMKKFVETEDFKNLNIGLSLDEGATSPTEQFCLFYAERNIWQMCIHCPGQAGHGSLLLENTAGEKITYMLNKIYEFRQQESKKLKNKALLFVGDVTTVNVTKLEGGLLANVIPPELCITVDCRITVKQDLDEFEKTLKQWCSEAGSGVWIEFLLKQPQVPPTKLDKTNRFWTAFKQATDELGLKLAPIVCPGATDSRYIRAQGIPALGFSPINETPILLHDNNEYLGVNKFLDGIGIYMKIIKNVANC